MTTADVPQPQPVKWITKGGVRDIENALIVDHHGHPAPRVPSPDHIIARIAPAIDQFRHQERRTGQDADTAPHAHQLRLTPRAEHQAIADAVDIPQILYNVPGRTACDMQADTVAELAKVSNIVGIKEATGSMERLADIKRQVDDNFTLLTGDDSTTCEFILNGGHGAISVTANVVPAKMANMCQLALEGKAAEARAADAEIAELHRLLFIESNPIPVKWAVSQMGFGELNLRLPMTVLDEKYQQPLKEALVASGAL